MRKLTCRTNFISPVRLCLIPHHFGDHVIIQSQKLLQLHSIIITFLQINIFIPQMCTDVDLVRGVIIDVFVEQQMCDPLASHQYIVRRIGI